MTIYDMYELRLGGESCRAASPDENTDLPKV